MTVKFSDDVIIAAEVIERGTEIHVSSLKSLQSDCFLIELQKIDETVFLRLVDTAIEIEVPINRRQAMGLVDAIKNFGLFDETAPRTERSPLMLIHPEFNTTDNPKC